MSDFLGIDFDINKDFVFTTGPDGNLKGGGFNIHSELLNDVINDGKDGTIDNIQSGGNSAILNTFKDLAVPAGLFFTQKQVQKNNTIRYEHKDGVIEDTLYDKLLGMLEPNKRKLHGRKTRSKRENNKKQTKKRKM